jgi:N4-(beta-N-acetylglucosaminyl)-L-asparaginase
MHSRAAAPVNASSPRRRSNAPPIVIASANGHGFKNGGEQTCVEKAFAILAEGGDLLDALIAGVTINELDPGDMSVGYGGRPNADGVVQLDACCMDGARKRAGGVAALEAVRTPSAVARAVMEHTDHHLLVGEDARRFARQMGFPIETDLNTEPSRRAWLEWKRRTDPAHFLDPDQRLELEQDARQRMIREGLLDPEHFSGTLHCSAMNAKGELAGVTTTSGLAFKIPGRVGDSPILGAGLYVDGDVGAAGSTGRGEASLYNLSSFLIVEELRRGRSPEDAGLEALRRIAANTVEQRLLNSRGLPNFQVTFYVLTAQGEHGDAAAPG